MTKPTRNRFFQRTSHPYYIVAPAFKQTSAGVRALHYLCHLLNESGHEAYVSASPENCSKHLRTPQLTPEVMQEHKASGVTPIAVYPEVVKGNPLGLNAVVRWVLNIPGHLGGDDSYPESDLIFHYSNIILDGIISDRLDMPLVDQRIFNEGNGENHRKGFCYYAGKYLHFQHKIAPEVLENPEGISLTLNIPRSHQEIAEILRTTETLYTYECSMLIFEALACGCAVAYVETPYLDQFINTIENAPIVIPRVKEHEIGRTVIPKPPREAVDEFLAETEKNALDDVKNFISKTQNLAEKISETKSSVNSLIPDLSSNTSPSFVSSKTIKTLGSEIYDLWREKLDSLKQFQAKIANPPSHHPDNLLSIVVHAPLDWLHLLANTIDSLAGHASPQWHLIVVTTIDSPEELESIDRILWINETEPAVIKHAIDGMVGRIDSRWVMEIPCGTLIDEDLVRHLAEIDQERVKAVFCDDDLYDESGKRFSPRFKPGVNPEALLSSDLAGPLCVDTKAWLLNGGTWLAGYTPWFEQLLTISERYGWKAVHHQADVLLSHHPATRTHAKSCLLALEQHLETKYPEANFIMANDEYWSVHYPLPAPPPSVDIFIYSLGDLGLINRCLQSIKENTDYPDFRIGLILESHESDPDLDAWIAAYTEANPTSLVIRSKTQTSFPTLANQAISSSRASYSLFINDESVAIHKEWLEELIRPCCQQNVAGASPRLIKPGSGLIENAGYILGLCSWRASPYQGKSNDEKREGFDWLDCARDVTTLCPACFLINNAHAISAGLMDQEGFFDQTALADLSLRLFDQGLRLLYIPRANLVGSSEPPVPLHAPFKEQADFILDRKKNQDTFSQRWWPRFAHDPFWNQNLALNELVPTPETEFMPDWFFRDDGKPRILAHVLANAQADFRITDPLRALRRQNKVATCVWEQHVFTAPRFHTASELYRLNPDVHIVQHYIQDDALAAMNTWRGLSHRPFTVYALDDAVTDIDTKSPFFKNFAANTRTRLKYALARADRMVVSTDFLAELYKNLISDIQVVPNRLEMEKWLSLRTAKRTSSKPRIGWAGGTTHQRDLSLLKEVIEQTREEADWIFFGMCPDEILPLVKETYPFMSFDEYPTFLASLNFDIAVAPLAETVFNRGKSNLRLLEYGILGLPVVCTDIEPYRNSPACRVRNNADHWVSALRERIHDADAREAEGRAMRRWVQEKFLLENHLDEWLLAHTPN